MTKTHFKIGVTLRVTPGTRHIPQLLSIYITLRFYNPTNTEAIVLEKTIKKTKLYISNHCIEMLLNLAGIRVDVDEHVAKTKK